MGKYFEKTMPMLSPLFQCHQYECINLASEFFHGLGYAECAIQYELGGLCLKILNGF